MISLHIIAHLSQLRQYVMSKHSKGMNAYLLKDFTVSIRSSILSAVTRISLSPTLIIHNALIHTSGMCEINYVYTGTHIFTFNLCQCKTTTQTDIATLSTFI